MSAEVKGLSNLELESCAIFFVQLLLRAEPQLFNPILDPFCLSAQLVALLGEMANITPDPKLSFFQAFDYTAVSSSEATFD